jgi:hypothetical protein
MINVGKLELAPLQIKGNYIASQIFYNKTFYGFLNVTIKPFEIKFYVDNSVEDDLSKELETIKEFVRQQLGYHAKTNIKANIEYEVKKFDKDGKEIITKHTAETVM